MSQKNPFLTKADGSAVDPKAYKEAFLKDPQKVARIKDYPDMMEMLNSKDHSAFQKHLRDEWTSLMQQRDDTTSSRELLRAKSNFPVDVVAMYRDMDEMGLQYGPAFQALETLHCRGPEVTPGIASRIAE